MRAYRYASLRSPFSGANDLIRHSFSNPARSATRIEPRFQGSMNASSPSTPPSVSYQSATTVTASEVKPLRLLDPWIQ